MRERLETSYGPSVVCISNTPVILIQPTRLATNSADINNEAAKKSKNPFFLIWTAMARVDFYSLYMKKGDYMFVIFSKS